MVRPTAPTDVTPDVQPVDRDERLGDAIEQYLALAEAGTPPDPEGFAAKYPDLSDDLMAALEGLAMVEGLVGSRSGGGPGGHLEAGRRVAGYRIVRELGRGGMGVVYEAVHVDLDRPVALKVLNTTAAPDSSGRRRFLNEAKTAAGLHHTHIVPVFDVGQVGGLCYYAMQRIEGCGLDRVVKALRKGRSTAAGSSSGRKTTEAAILETLDATSIGDPTRSWFGASKARPGHLAPERIDEPPPFEPPRGSEYYRWVARAGGQAADALAHAHRRGVIHRDVKPSNLLVDARGTVWVADFGLARRLADPGITQGDSLLGTPRYMSPEQSEVGPIDGRTDVYSLGATLYELLTLRPPFDGRTAAELIGQIKDREPVAPRKVDPRLPRDLETIVMKAMAKRPGDRYADAGELVDDLHRFLAMEPVKARRIGPVGRAWRFAQRHPALTAVSTIATVAVLSTATVAYARVVEERNKAIAAQEDTQQALQNVEVAQKALKGKTIEILYRDAVAGRQNHVPDLRAIGLARLKEAVALGPDPAMTVRLRDEAVRFLALRDIEPRPALPTGPARRIAFTEAHERLAVLAEDGTSLDLWDLDRRDRIARYPLADAPGAPGGRIPRVFLPSAGLAASGSTIAVVRPENNGVRIFDPERGGIFTDLAMPRQHIMSLLMARDGGRVVTIEDQRFGARGGDGPGRPPADRYRVQIWNARLPGAAIATLALPEPNPDSLVPPQARNRPPLVACAPRGSTIATANFMGTSIVLWDAETGAKTAEIATEGMITSLAIGSDGPVADGVLAASYNGSISRWDLRSQKPLPGLSMHQPYIGIMRFSPDGSLLAVAGLFNSVDLWDPEANTLMASMPTTRPADDLAFSPDGRSLAVAVGDESRLWTMVEPIGRAHLAAPETKTSAQVALAFGPTGSLAATFTTSRSSSTRLQCPDGGMTTRDHPRTRAVAFDPAGRLIVPNGNALEFYATGRDESPEFTVPLPDPLASPADRHPDGPRGRARPDGPPRDRPPGGGSEPLVVYATRASADGRTLALLRWKVEPLLVRFGAEDVPPTITAIRRADEAGPTDDEPRGRARGRGPRPGAHPGDLKDADRGFGWILALSPDGRRFYASSDLEPRAWAIEGDVAREIPWAHTYRDVDKIAASPDGRFLALGHLDGALSIVDADDGAFRASVPALAETDRITSLAFSREGQLAIGYHSGRISLWAVAEDGQVAPVVKLPGDQVEVKGLVYSHDGRRLAAGTDAGADIWDLVQVRDRLAAIGLGW